MKKNRVWLAVLPFVISACIGTSKSSTPLSPAIAGPIAGVGITAPAVMAPAVDAQINASAQPITLKVQNATTTGVRPLTYLFEVATDLNFTNKVVSHGGVAQDPSGATSYQLASLLAPERKYYWHARAEDGANTGDFGGTSAFTIFTPVVLGAPTLVAPIGDVTTSDQQPTFVFGDVDRTGPAGAIVYYIEIATSASFSSVVAAYSFPETANQSQITVPNALPAGQYFWHVRASDGGHTGPFSAVQSFHTPAAGSGGGGGGGVTHGGSFNPNGPWQSCGSTPGGDLVLCVYNAITPSNSVEDIFELTKRVAWLLRGSGFGLLRKDGGANIVTWNGTSFAAARIVMPDGHLFKVLTDVPNGDPEWSDEGVDPTLIPLWIAPMQP